MDTAEAVLPCRGARYLPGTRSGSGADRVAACALAVAMEPDQHVLGAVVLHRIHPQSLADRCSCPGFLPTRSGDVTTDVSFGQRWRTSVTSSDSRSAIIAHVSAQTPLSLPPGGNEYAMSNCVRSWICHENELMVPPRYSGTVSGCRGSGAPDRPRSIVAAFPAVRQHGGDGGRVA